MTKYNFTKTQFEEIKSLLKNRLIESKDKQKGTRTKIRKLGFKISDHHNGFTDHDFQKLANSGIIKIINQSIIPAIENNKIKELTEQKKSNTNIKKSLLPIVDENTEIIILGTMPSENSLKNQQYYNNSRNQFWKIIFSIFNKEIIFKEISPNDYEKKTNLLKQHQIGLWDVLKTCEREGSTDANITNATVNDFEIFFKKYPNIKTIIFNGKDSLKYFKKSVKANIKNKKLIQLNSTSSLNSHKTIDQKIEEWKQYLKKTPHNSGYAPGGKSSSVDR